MRSEQEVIDQILRIANSDDRVRAVLLTGSRADPSATKDIFRDFDIIYIVTQLEEFVSNKHWVDAFGERLILQMPEQMTIGRRDRYAFHYLMLCSDGTRIDLTLFPFERVNTDLKKDSLLTVLLDKDNLFPGMPPPGNADYLIRPPSEKEFVDCCNEFWWVSTYVAKGLWRKQITYAKHMMEIPVRTMFLMMIEWYIGAITQFTVPFGPGGRNMKKHISADLHHKILSTYPDSNIGNIWNSLFLMTALFDELAQYVSAFMGFRYNKEEATNVTKYLKWVRDSQRQNESI